MSLISMISSFLLPKAILDRHLYGIIFFLFGIDVILLTIWMVISPYNMKVTELSRVVSEFILIYSNECPAKCKTHS